MLNKVPWRLCARHKGKIVIYVTIYQKKNFSTISYSLKVPNVTRKRGKGSSVETSTIGLPKIHKTQGLTPFIKVLPCEKEKGRY